MLQKKTLNTDLAQWTPLGCPVTPGKRELCPWWVINSLRYWNYMNLQGFKGISCTFRKQRHHCSCPLNWYLGTTCFLLLEAMNLPQNTKPSMHKEGFQLRGVFLTFQCLTLCWCSFTLSVHICASALRRQCVWLPPTSRSVVSPPSFSSRCKMILSSSQ